MPSPRKDEPKEDFISRCMGDEEARKTFPDQKQRAAFCYSQWRNRNKKDELCPECMKKLGLTQFFDYL